jgi:GMP synthase - Glutamine amidotransferase domain
MAKPILIIAAGTSFTEITSLHGDFGDWIASGLNDANVQYVNATEEKLPDPKTIAGAVISGSHAMVTDKESWSETLAEWIRQAVAVDMPILGICYGHQLIAHALGGRVGYRGDGFELGSHFIELHQGADSDPLFKQLPLKFDAHLVHAQAVVQLPPQATLLGSSAGEPHQCYRVGQHVWGVQFHPEFNETVMQLYIDYLLRDGRIPSTTKTAVSPTPYSAELLKHFAEYTRRR